MGRFQNVLMEKLEKSPYKDIQFGSKSYRKVLQLYMKPEGKSSVPCYTRQKLSLVSLNLGISSEVDSEGPNNAIQSVARETGSANAPNKSDWSCFHSSVKWISNSFSSQLLSLPRLRQSAMHLLKPENMQPNNQCHGLMLHYLAHLPCSHACKILQSILRRRGGRIDLPTNMLMAQSSNTGIDAKDLNGGEMIKQEGAMQAILHYVLVARTNHLNLR
ncbi:hypothetical protein Salat_2934700 [Sesamum alatum]|uniref:Uncharacterized protein n=1 Tax=Sesamum alatum TaxID=300844 RepID=A0AAE1XJ11_9LAMI|nr:hypothetical protein Salat_2934700 [Sesamum alatum]